MKEWIRKHVETMRKLHSAKRIIKRTKPIPAHGQIISDTKK